MSGINLIHGDAIDELKRIPSNSHDIVVTSPPYNMNLRIRNGKYCSRQIVKELTTKYSGFNDNLPLDEYYNFNATLLNECIRVSPLVFYNVQFLTGNKRPLFKLMGNFSDLIKEVIIWDKVNCQPAIGVGVLNSQWEAIIVLSSCSSISRKFESAQFNRGTLSNLWKIKSGRSPLKSHKATFPIELVQTILSNFAKEGDKVLDPLMGTGTVGAVAKGLQMGFTGIEKVKEYYEFAVDRVGAQNG